MSKQRRNLSGGIVLLLVAVTLAYSNTFSGPFIFDDTIGIVENSSIRNLWSPESVGMISRPVVNFSLAVNYAISGLEVWSYHLFNLLVHLLAAVTLLGIVGRTLRFSGDGISAEDVFAFSLVCALLWALHPLQTQAVTYVIQRCESLMALFLMLTLYCALRGWQANPPGPWHLLAVLAFLLAAGSKETAAVAPLLLLTYEWVFRGQGPIQAMRRSPLLYAGLALGTVVMVALAVMGNTLISATEETPISAFAYWITQCEVILHYLRLTLWPSGLTIDYAWPAATLRDVWPAIAAVLMLLGLSCWAAARRHPAGFLGLSFFFLLAPTSLIPLPDLAFEHRMYLPLAPLIALLVGAAIQGYRWGIERLHLPPMPSGSPARRASLALIACLALGLGFLTFQRNSDYRSEKTIWADTLQKRPANFRGHHGLGLALSREGRREEALGSLLRAVELNPRNAYAQNDAGYLLVLLQRPEEAIPFFRESIRIKPRFAKAHNNLGAALAQTNRLEEAIAHFVLSLQIKPDYASARDNLRRASAALEQRAGSRR